MFRKIILNSTALFLAAFIFFAVGTVSSAKAQSVCLQQGQSQSFIYTSSFGTDGSASATFTLINNVIVVKYKNTSTADSYLSGIAFNSEERNLPKNIVGGTATSGWSVIAGPGGGLGNYDLGAYGNGGKRRLSPGQSGTATLVFGSKPVYVCIDKTIVHLTSLPDGSSEKPVGVIADSGTGEGDGNDGAIID